MSLAQREGRCAQGQEHFHTLLETAPSYSSTEDQWVDVRQESKHSAVNGGLGLEIARDGTSSSEVIGMNCSSPKLLEHITLQDQRYYSTPPPDHGYGDVDAACTQYTTSMPWRTLDLDEHFARSRYQLARQQGMNCLRAAHTSAELLLKALLQSDSKTSVDRAMIEPLENRALEDLANIAEQFQVLLQAEQNLSIAERNRETSEGQRRLQTSGASPQDFNRKHSVDDPSNGSERYSNTPAIVKKYFRLAQVVFILKERLRDLDPVHEGTLADPPRDSDASSCSTGGTCRWNRADLSASLESAQNQLHGLKDCCLAQSIDPEDFRYRRISGQSQLEEAERDLLD